MALVNHNAIARHLAEFGLMPCRQCGATTLDMADDLVALVPFFLRDWPAEALRFKVDSVACIGEALVQVTCPDCRQVILLSIDDWDAAPVDLYDEPEEPDQGRTGPPLQAV